MLLNFYYLYTMFFIKYAETTVFTKMNGKEETFVLKPVEALVERIYNEDQLPEVTLKNKHHEADIPRRDTRYGREFTKTKEVDSEVDAGKLIRKVWSRWSKWGQCSATCGVGTKTRRRLCLTGRCAPGEREEQRRPCCRQPCEEVYPGSGSFVKQ